MVDLEGYVALHTNRYSVPVDWIGRRVEVRETRDKIEIQRDARNLVTHTRIAEAEHQRIMLAQHWPPRGQGIGRPDPHPEEKAILEAAPEMAGYVAAMKQRGRKAPIWDRLSVHYTPKHGSWLDQAEIELSLYSRQCLGTRRIPDLATLKRETKAWNRKANRKRTKINWRFTRKHARKVFKYKSPGRRG